MELNNKGQALVTFVLLIPIVLIVMVIIIDIGLMGVQKRKITNVVKDTIEYGLNNNSSEEELRNLIKENVNYDNVDINIKDDIVINLKCSYKTIFGFIKRNQLNIKYRGYRDNNQIRIEGI